MFSFLRSARPTGRALALAVGAAVLALAAGSFVPAAAVTGNASPTISGDPPPVTPGGDGEYVNFDFTLGGSPTPSCTVAGTLPEGTYLRQPCGLSGFVTRAQAGDYPITVTAGNGVGPDAVQHTTFRVYGAPGFAAQAVVVPFFEPFSRQLPATGNPAPTFELAGGSLPDGLALDATGLLHGTPVDSTVNQVSIRVTNSAGAATGTLDIYSGAGSLTDQPPPAFTVGSPVEFTFNGDESGGTIFVYDVTAGQLPPGLALNFQSGALTGTPQQSGDFPVSVTISHFNGPVQTKEYLLHVDAAPADPAVPAPTIDGTPAIGTVGQTYSAPFTVTGSPTCTADGLPPGLSFDPQTCVLAGTPTAAGSYDATFTAANGTAPDATIHRTVVIDGAPTIPAGQRLDAVTGRAVDFQLQLTGFPEPTVTLFDGASLPEGLSMDAHGHITGTPTSIGFQRVDLSLKNSAGQVSGQLVISVTGVAPTITSAAPPEISYGSAYGFTVQGGGDPAAAYEVVGRLPSGIALDRDTGKLSGTSTELGDFQVTIRAFNGYGEDRRNYTLHVTGTPPAITNTPTPVTAGVPYSFAFDTGSANPLPTFQVVSGSLPSGLSLSSTGRITGTTTQVTTGSSVTVRAHSGVGQDAEVTFTLPVNAGPPWFTATPAETTTATVGSPYYGPYYASGAPVTPTISVTAGQLPPGLTLDDFGAIVGTPTTPGTYTFTVTATNGMSPDASVVRTIVVSGTSPSITGTPPSGTVGTSYAFGYQLGGAPAPTTSLVAGTLPAGLTIGADGHLTGTPTTAGTYTFTVQAGNGVGNPATVRSTVTVGAASVLSLSGTPGPGGVGEAYSFTFTTTGTPAPRVAVSAGQLPPGLSLSATGKLSGTPRTAGTYRFTVRAANGVGTPVTRQATVQIRPLPTVSISDSGATEGNSGTRALRFIVSLNRPSSAPVTVRWTTANSSATAGSDYVAASGTVTFQPGSTTATVTVLLRGDRVKERNESFLVRLSSPRSATLARTAGYGGILNDD